MELLQIKFNGKIWIKWQILPFPFIFSVFIFKNSFLDPDLQLWLAVPLPLSPPPGNLCGAGGVITPFPPLHTPLLTVIQFWNTLDVLFDSLVGSGVIVPDPARVACGFWIQNTGICRMERSGWLVRLGGGWRSSRRSGRDCSGPTGTRQTRTRGPSSTGQE